MGGGPRPPSREALIRGLRGLAGEAREAAELERDAATVPGSTRTPDDARLPARVCAQEPDEMVREHAAWALARLARHGAV